MAAGDRELEVLMVRQGGFESESILITSLFSAQEEVEQELEGGPGMTRGMSCA